MSYVKPILNCILCIFIFTECEKPNSPPEATLDVSPPIGLESTIFDLDASGSSDIESIPQLLEFRWDYDGDGSWDTPFRNSGISAYQFSDPGDYTVTCEVRDPSGLTARCESKLIVTSIKTFIDGRDDKEYPMVLFGNTWWMASNLDHGTNIPPEQNQENNGIIEKYSYPEPEYPNLAGGLYQWNEAMNYQKIVGSRGICPDGWRLPSDQDWKNLFSHFMDPVGVLTPDYKIENVKYIPDQTVHHDNYHAEGAIWKILKQTGRSGLDVIMTGYRNPDGLFDNSDYYFPGETASFWTSSTYGNYAIRSRFYRNKSTGEVFRFWDNIEYGFSIRCIKDHD